MNKILALVIGTMILLVLSLTLMSLTSSSLGNFGQEAGNKETSCQAEVTQVESEVAGPKTVSEECIKYIEDDDKKDKAIASKADIPKK